MRYQAVHDQPYYSPHALADLHAPRAATVSHPCQKLQRCCTGLLHLLRRCMARRLTSERYDILSYAGTMLLACVRARKHCHFETVSSKIAKKIVGKKTNASSSSTIPHLQSIGLCLHSRLQTDRRPPAIRIPHRRNEKATSQGPMLCSLDYCKALVLNCRSPRSAEP